MIVLWVLLVIAVIWAIAESARGRREHYHEHGPSQSTLNTGLDILNERYAKGDITKEEYDQKKRDILGK